MKMLSLEDLYVAHLRDLYDAGNRLVKAWPRLSKAATTPELRAALGEHLKETCDQADRIERLLDKRGRKVKGRKCEAMKGLIAEAREALRGDAEPTVRDAALIAAAQKAGHYQIAA